MKKFTYVLLASLMALALATMAFAAPAFAFTPDEVWVDDCYTDTEDGWGVTHFDNIQAGVDAVATDGIVHVDEECLGGSYSQDVVIDHSLTLEGGQHGVDARTRMTLGTESHLTGSIKVTSDASDVTIDGFEITGTGAGPLAGVCMRVESEAATIKNNIIEAVEATGGYTYSGFVDLDGVSDALIEQNYIYGAYEADRAPNVIRIGVASGGTAITVQNNELDECGGGGGIGVMCGNPDAVIEITDNEINHTGDGIWFWNPGDTNFDSLTITGNDIHHCNACHSGEFCPPTCSDIDTGIKLAGTLGGSTVEICDNDFQDNKIQIRDSWEVLDMETVLACNTFDYIVLIDRPESSLVHVIYSFIQLAIDEALPGDTIIVHPGTYDEFLNVNVDELTVISTDGAEDTIIYPTTGGTPDQVVLIQGSNVVFGGPEQGFTVQVDNCGVYNPPDTGIRADPTMTENVQILYNTVIVDDVDEAYGIVAYDYGGDVVIEGNTVRLGGGETIGAGYGISAVDCSGTVLITLNFVEVIAGYEACGISADSCEIVKVLDNEVDVLVGEEECAFADGIYVSGVNKAQVANNTVDVETSGYYGSFAFGIGVFGFDRAEVGGQTNTVTVNAYSAFFGYSYGVILCDGNLANVLDNSVTSTAEVDYLYGMATGIGTFAIDDVEVGNNDPVTVTCNVPIPVEPMSVTLEDLQAMIPDRVAERLQEEAATDAEILNELLGITTLDVDLGGANGRGIRASDCGMPDIHDNNVNVDVDVTSAAGPEPEGSVSVEDFAFAMAFNSSQGIKVWDSFAPQIKGNEVTSTADVDATALAEGSMAFGMGAAFGLGIITGDCESGDGHLTTVDGNSVNAEGNTMVTVGAYEELGELGGESALAELDAELSEVYDIVQQTLAEQGTALSGEPQSLSFAFASGDGLAIGIGINAWECEEIQITSNDPVSGSGTADVEITAVEEVVIPEFAGGFGGGLGLGIGIRAIDCEGANIADNGLEEDVSGTGIADTTIMAAEMPVEPESAIAIGGGSGIGLGIRVRWCTPGLEITGNNVAAEGDAYTFVEALEAEDCECAFAKGDSLGVGLGIALGRLSLELSDGRAPLIEGNQVDAHAEAVTGVDAEAVCSEDPAGMGEAEALAIGIKSRGKILDNEATADAYAGSFVGAFEWSELPEEMDVFGMSGSLAVGTGMLVKQQGGGGSEVIGNNAQGTAEAECEVIASTEVPLDIAGGLSFSVGIGSGLTLDNLDDAEVNWNTLFGSGSAYVEATTEATFDYSAELGFSLSTGAKLIDTCCVDINYNDLLTPRTQEMVAGEHGFQAELSFGLLSLCSEDTNARFNYWGDPSGPSSMSEGIEIDFGDLDLEQAASAEGVTVEEVEGMDLEDILWLLTPKGIGESLGAYLGTPYKWWLSHPIADLLPEGVGSLENEVLHNVGYYGFHEPVYAGWNTLSTPIHLENPRWGDIVALGDGLDGDVAYRYDPTQVDPWQLMTADDLLKPLDAIYVRMDSDDVVFFTTSPRNEIATRDLPQEQSWYLIGPTPYNNNYPYVWTMSVDDALVSLEVTPGGNRAYNQVVSPAINRGLLGRPAPWAYVPGGGTPRMVKGEGYWVFMENADTLAGFTSTPLPIELPIWNPD